MSKKGNRVSLFAAVRWSSFRRCLLLSLTFPPAMRSIREISEKSPYHQHLPDCEAKDYKIVKKITDKKGIVCPMIKDEVGFLSEWVAFYEVQGFNHVKFYDNNSTSPMDELDPWIKSGFVTIERDWWLHAGSKVFKHKKNKFNDMMHIKQLGELQCKQFAVQNGYEIFVSVDLDEYLMPTDNSVTVMDELVRWFDSTTRGFMLISKMQFPPVPHILEPVNLLTIEAYQTRMNAPDKMNYYTSVSRKVALRLSGGEEYTNATTDLLVYCCDFHGCGNYRFHKPCGHWLKSDEMWKVTGKHKPWKNGPHMNHYARSLEKYLLKQETWDTAGPGRGYDIYNFMDRLSGFTFDDSAVAWGCQVRDVLRAGTGERDYLRPGNQWYRNPEFGRLVENPRKRGRNGAGFGKYLQPLDMSPYPPGETYQRAHKPYEAPPAKVP